jgi:hypothetical protein
VQTRTQSETDENQKSCFSKIDDFRKSTIFDFGRFWSILVYCRLPIRLRRPPPPKKG